MSLLSTRLREERRWATPCRRRPGDLTITITVDTSRFDRSLAARAVQLGWPWPPLDTRWGRGA